MRELETEEIKQVSGGEFRISPELGGTLQLGLVGLAVVASGPVLALSALGAAALLFGSVEDIRAVRDAREKLTSGSSGGGGITVNRTGGSKIRDKAA